ncbi:hypothetical protein ABNF97_25165 [Plantactinospora sp. B6F1]|uniref:SCO7613 C-terminal domain-containing membrane protein n=1 Tax=Plantactinospora sp. B6F1 TaxID=3158971 RepID=UPI0032D97BAB
MRASDIHGDDAVRLARLDRVIAQCDARAEYLRGQQEQVQRQRREAVAQRDELLAAERARLARPAQVPAPLSPVVAPAAVPPRLAPPQPSVPPVRQPSVPPVTPQPVREVLSPPPAPPSSPAVRPEASVLQVQNVLLALGGVLLGAAAITFSVVAWTTFGQAGQALILAAGTVIAVTTPVLLARRGLVATAETISAVALLLVLLDGFAVWSLGLFGVDRVLPVSAYAGLTFLVTSAVAAGYRAVTRLTVPRYVALIAAQPVLPMIALGALDDDGAAPTRQADFSWSDLSRLTVGFALTSLLANAVAVQNLVAAARLTRAGSGPLPLRALAWVLHGLALAGAGALAATALATATAPLPGMFSATVLLLSATLAVRSATVVGHPAVRHVATGAATVTAVFAVYRVIALMWAPAGLVVLAAAVTVAVVVARALPPPWRRGPITASAGMVILLGVLLGAWSLVVAVRVLAAAFPAWQAAGVEPIGGRLAGWQLPAAMLIVSVGVAMLLGRRTAHQAILAGFALLAIVAPASSGLPWWVRPWIAVAAALALGLSGLLSPGRRAEEAGPGDRGDPGDEGQLGYLPVWAGLALGGYAFVTALPRAWLTAAVLATLAAGCFLIARLGRRPSAAATNLRSVHIADAAFGGFLAILPGIAGAGLAALNADATAVRTVTSAVAALSLVAGAVALTRRRTAPGATVGAACGALLTGSANLLSGSPPTFADAGTAVLLGLSATLLIAAVRRSEPHSPGNRLLLVAHAVTTLAVVASAVGLVSVAAPGLRLVTAAALTSAVGLAAARRASPWRRGPAAGALVAGAALALTCGLIAIVEGSTAVMASMNPRPWAADLGRWPDLVAVVAAYGRQVPFALALLVAGALALPERYRDPAALTAGALSLLAAPVAFGLPWWAPSAVSGASGTLLALAAVRVQDSRAGRRLAVVAALFGVHAAGAALGRSWSTALVLGTAVVVCAAVGLIGHAAPPGHQARWVADAAIGGGLAALPGAVASAAAMVGLPPATVVALGLATASAALTVGSVVRLARGGEAPAHGAAAGAVLIGVIVWSGGAPTLADHLAVAFLFLAAALRLIPRSRPAGRAVRVAYQEAAGVTLALLVSLSRLAAVLLPGYALLTTAAVVLLVAFGVGLLPLAWRRGPAGAAGLALAAVAAVASALAVARAVQVLVDGTPAWRADLDGWLAGGPVAGDIVGWQPLAALILIAATALALADSPVVRGWGYRVARDSAAAALILAVVDAPVSLRMPWWAPTMLAGLVAFGCGLSATRARAARPRLRFAAAGALLGLYAAAAALPRPALTAAVLCGVVLCGAVVAASLPAGEREPAGEDPDAAAHRLVGGVAAAGALIALPGATAAVGAAAGLGAGPLLRGALAATVVAFGVVVWLRRACPAYLPYGSVAVPVGGTVVALATLTSAEPTGGYAALAAVLGVGAGLLAPPGRRPGTVVAAASPMALIAAVAVLPAVAAVLFRPYAWLGVGWGPAPRGSIDGLAPGANGWPGTAWHPMALALLALGAGMCVRGLGRPRQPWTWPAVLSCAALAVSIMPVAWDAPWPAGPGTALLVAAGTGVWAARRGWPDSAGGRSLTATAVVLCGLLGGTGISGALPTEPATYAGLSLAVAAGLAAAVVGRRTGGRLAGWHSVGVAALSLLAAVATGAHLAPEQFSSSLVVLAVLLLLAAAVLPHHQRTEVATTEMMSYLIAGLAALTAGAADLRVTALILVGYGVALGLSALRPRRWRLAVAGAGCELLACWLLLFAGGVGVVEAYTLPAALLALLGGALELRRRPHLHSWLAYGPALVATFLPSIALLLAGAEYPARRLLLGVGGFLVLVLGAARRRQAPVVGGAGVLAVITVYEVVRYWDMLPRWLPMGIGGVVLIVVGATYERRRRDLRRLRQAVTRMG